MLGRKFNQTVKITKRQMAYSTALVLTAVLAFILLIPSNQNLHAHGPMNVGHEKRKCNDCHELAQGPLRQQLQANVKYLFGFREKPVAMGHQKVSNRQCVTCHERPNDTHPVYRFMEPRFEKVRALLKPQECISCHNEHNAKRVTVDNLFCQHCHTKLSIKKDVLTISHATLVKQKQWKTCLGCHDYHGNHRMTINKEMDNLISERVVLNYFQGATSPYSLQKKYKAKSQ